jgi:hypothetical protein
MRLVALAVTIAVPDTVAPPAGAVIDTTGGATALLTVTVSPALVVLTPAVSFAMAFSVCEPLELFAVSQLYVYGATVIGLPTLAPSSWNCTLATPMLLVALAVTVAVPDTVAPLAGAVIDTTGGAVLELFTTNGTPALDAVLPAPSVALAVRV